MMLFQVIGGDTVGTLVMTPYAALAFTCLSVQAAIPCDLPSWTDEGKNFLSRFFLIHSGQV